MFSTSLRTWLEPMNSACSRPSHRLKLADRHRRSFMRWLPSGFPTRSREARRDFMLRVGALGTGGFALPQLLRAEAAQAAASETASARSGRAKACILIYLWGGPPQQDMWDMKPEAPEGIRSQFSP